MLLEDGTADLFCLRVECLPARISSLSKQEANASVKCLLENEIEACSMEE